MGVAYSTLENLSHDYQNYPPGCVPCPEGYKPGNPGTFEEIHKKFDHLESRLFDADQVREEDREQGYRFGASYVGTKRVGPRERYPQLYGDMRPNGDVTANFAHTLGCRCRLKLAAKIKGGRYECIRSTVEYRTDDCTVGVTLVNPVVAKQQGVLVLQYLQAASPRMTLGVELAHNHGSENPGSRRTNWALAYRYSTGFRTLSTTVGQAGVRVCYHHKQSQHLQMGVEHQENFVAGQSKSRLVYRVDAPMAEVVLRGFVDTNWRVGAVFEKRLHPILEGSLLLSAVMDHAKHNISVGVGLNIGQ
ncbi:mitochondrial import receptor subunit TOM40 homolog 1-like [Copidosoma floridanum]|uniref:mitochondrial import receptor subunit TOM40 homolog 1-like n=1 Tax=Copidosoma floridanum TaxID=29053 RepID=UPI0006C9D82B|nr:mitochondrial import receptor subunit TOM40 homolog 1-like [Copidosoma floridanum]